MTLDDIDRKIAELQAQRQELIEIGRQRRERVTGPLLLRATDRAFLHHLLACHRHEALEWGLSDEEYGVLYSQLIQGL